MPQQIVLVLENDYLMNFQFQLRHLAKCTTAPRYVLEWEVENLLIAIHFTTIGWLWQDDTVSSLNWEQLENSKIASRKGNLNDFVPSIACTIWILRFLYTLSHKQPMQLLLLINMYEIALEGFPFIVENKTNKSMMRVKFTDAPWQLRSATSARKIEKQRVHQFPSMSRLPHRLRFNNGSISIYL